MVGVLDWQRCMMRSLVARADRVRGLYFRIDPRFPEWSHLRIDLRPSARAVLRQWEPSRWALTVVLDTMEPIPSGDYDDIDLAAQGLLIKAGNNRAQGTEP